MKSRWFWIGLPIGLLGISVLAHVVLIVVSINDPSFALEPDYERKARNWDAIQRQRAANVRLGWTVDLSTRPASRPGEVDVAVALFDRYGKPLRAATIQAETFHNARAAQILRAAFQADGEGLYEATLPIRRSGIWEFRLTVQNGDDLWIDSIRKSVISTPRFGKTGP